MILVYYVKATSSDIGGCYRWFNSTFTFVSVFCFLHIHVFIYLMRGKVNDMKVYVKRVIFEKLNNMFC